MRKSSSNLKAKLEISADLGPAKIQLDAFVHEMEALEKTRAKLFSKQNLKGQDKEGLKKQIAEIDKQIESVSKNAQRYLEAIHRVQLANAKTLHETAKKNAQEMISWAKKLDAETNKTHKESLSGTKAQERADKAAHNARLANIKAEENAQRNLNRIFMQNLAAQKQAQNANHQAALAQLKALEVQARNAATAAVAASRVETQQTIQGLNNARTANVQGAFPGVVAGSDMKMLSLGRMQAQDQSRQDALGIGRGFLSGGLRGDRLNQFQGFWKTYSNEIKNLDARLATDLAGLYQKHFGGGKGLFGKMFGGSGGPFGSSTNKFIGQLFGIYGAGYAAKRVFQGIEGATVAGASAYMDFEKKNALLTGSINTSYDLYNGNRRIIDPGELASASMQYSKTLFKQVRQKAIESPLNLKDLFDVVPVALSALGGKGMQVNKVLDVANLSASIGKMMGYREGSYIDDIRTLGANGPLKNAQSFMAMGYTKDSWKKLQSMNGDEMYQDIMKHGQAFKRPLEDFKSSMTSAVDQVKDAIYSSSVRIGEKMMPAIKSITGSINDQLKKWESDGTVDKLADSLSSILTITANFMKGAVDLAAKIHDMFPNSFLFGSGANDEANREREKQRVMDAHPFSNNLREKEEFQAGLKYTARKAGLPTNKLHGYLENPNTPEAKSYFAKLEQARVANANLSDFADYKNQRIMELTGVSADAMRLLTRENLDLDKAGSTFYRGSAGFAELRGIIENPHSREDFKNNLKQAIDESYYFPGSIPVSSIVRGYQGTKAESKKTGKAFGKTLLGDTSFDLRALPRKPVKGGGNGNKGNSVGSIDPDMTGYAKTIRDYESQINALDIEMNSGYTSELRKIAIPRDIAHLKALIGDTQVEMAQATANAAIGIYNKGTQFEVQSGRVGGKSTLAPMRIKGFENGKLNSLLNDKTLQGLHNKQNKKDVGVINAEGEAGNLHAQANAADIEYQRLLVEYRKKQSNVLKTFMNKGKLDDIDFALSNSNLIKASQRGPLERQKYLIGALPDQVRGDIDELIKSGFSPLGAAMAASVRGKNSLKTFDARYRDDVSEEERLFREQKDRERYDRKYLLADRARQNSTLFGGDLQIAKNTQTIEDLQKMNLDHRFDALIYALQRNTEAVQSASEQRSLLAGFAYEDKSNSIFGNPLTNEGKYTQDFNRNQNKLLKLTIPQKRALLMATTGFGGGDETNINDRIKALSLGFVNRKSFNNAKYMDQLAGGIGNALPQILRGQIGDGIGTVAGSYSNLDLNLNGSLSKLLKGKGKLGGRLSSKEWGGMGEFVVQNFAPGVLGKNSYSSEGSQLGGMAAAMGAFAGLGAWAGPVGALGGALLGSLFKKKSGPSPEEQAIKEWQKRVVDLLNNIDKSLRPQEDYFRSVKNEIFGSASRYWSGRSHSGLGFQNSLGAM